jgi:hypothetical protein
MATSRPSLKEFHVKHVQCILVMAFFYIGVALMSGAAVAAIWPDPDDVSPALLMLWGFASFLVSMFVDAE